MTIKNNLRSAFSSQGSTLLAVGGLASAIGAASCCVVPFAMFTLGVGGAWISNLTALEPYQPVFIAIAITCLGYGFHFVYRKPRIACAENQFCARPFATRMAKIALWTATVSVILAVAFPYAAAPFL